jgi:hypothetical protein
MQDVDFELTRETVQSMLIGQKVYHKTNYLVLRHKDGAYAVVKVHGSGYGMFKTVESVEVISLPEETSFVKDPKADAFNHNSLSEAAKEADSRVVVLETEFDHITFVVKEDPITIHLVDVVPPYPSKLLVLAERALTQMTLSRPIKIVPRLVDITKLVQADEIVYPCRATEMGEHSHAKFLHERPEMGDEAVVVGCDISRKIFLSEYKRKPKLVNICPKNFIDSLEGPKLIKCCLVEGKVEMEGDLAIVPWGVKVEEIREAFRRLIDLVMEQGD